MMEKNFLHPVTIQAKRPCSLSPFSSTSLHPPTSFVSRIYANESLTSDNLSARWDGGISRMGEKKGNPLFFAPHLNKISLTPPFPLKGVSLAGREKTKLLRKFVFPEKGGKRKLKTSFKTKKTAREKKENRKRPPGQISHSPHLSPFSPRKNRRLFFFFFFLRNMRAG